MGLHIIALLLPMVFRDNQINTGDGRQQGMPLRIVKMRCLALEQVKFVARERHRQVIAKRTRPLQQQDMPVMQRIKGTIGNNFSGHLFGLPDIFISHNDDYTQGKPISTSQTQKQRYGPLILGGTGRVGRMLAAVWPDAPAPLWQSRKGGDVVWDILAQDAPALPQPISAVIVLAGVTRGTDAQLAQNTALAQAGAALAQRLGVRALIASSQAVYGRQTGVLSETIAPTPASAYGQAKLDMEQAVTGTHITHLRIGNVAGCDGLFGAMARGPVTIDQFPDGQGPRRMMIGPRDLAQVLAALCVAPDLPPVLNIARPNLIAMADMADAAGVAWGWQPAPATALPELAMDVTALSRIVAQTDTSAADLVAQARAGGWVAA